MKTKAPPAKVAPSYSVSNCNFSSSPPPEFIAAIAALARAAEANAEAIKQIASTVKAPNSLLHVGPSN